MYAWAGWENEILYGTFNVSSFRSLCKGLCRCGKLLEVFSSAFYFLGIF